MKLKELRELGFDNSYHVPFSKGFRVLCSQCQAMVINGIPCHEQECPNENISDKEEE